MTRNKKSTRVARAAKSAKKTKRRKSNASKVYVDTMDIKSNHLRDIINYRLEKDGRSKYWLVNRANVSEAVVYRYLGGQSETTTDNLRRMLVAVGFELIIRDGQESD